MLQVQVPGEVHCQSRNGLKNGMRCGHVVHTHVYSIGHSLVFLVDGMYITLWYCMIDGTWYCGLHVDGMHWSPFGIVWW